MKEIPEKYSNKLKTLLYEILYCDVEEHPSMAKILSNEYVLESIRKLETEMSKRHKMNRKISHINAKHKKLRTRKGINEFQYERNAQEVKQAMQKRHPARIIVDTAKELLQMRTRRENYVQMQVEEEPKIKEPEEQAKEKLEPEPVEQKTKMEQAKAEIPKKKKIPPIHAQHNVKSSRLLEIYEKNRRKRKKKAKKKTQKNNTDLPTKLKFIKGNKYNQRKQYVGQRKKETKREAQKTKTGNSSNWLSHSEMLMRSMIHQRMRRDKRSRVIRSELPNQQTSAVPLQNHLKNQGELPRKCAIKMKEFGQWFTEDYFENCLILDGEFGLNYLSEFKNPVGETVEPVKRRKSPAKRSFRKKKNIERVDESSSHLNSNERLARTISNEYTVSNNRNQIGREVKQILEEKSRKLLRNESPEEDLRSQSGLNLDKHFDSIQFSVFLNKMRIVLRFMKQKQANEAVTRTRNKSAESKRGKSRRQMRRVHSSKKMETYDKWLKASVMDSVEQRRGPAKGETGTGLEVYLKYHDHFLGVMEGFLRQKWSEELLESSQLIQVEPPQTSRDFKKKSEVNTCSTFKEAKTEKTAKKNENTKIKEKKKDEVKSEMLLKFDSAQKNKEKLVRSQIIGNKKEKKEKKKNQKLRKKKKEIKIEKKKEKKEKRAQNSKKQENIKDENRENEEKRGQNKVEIIKPNNEKQEKVLNIDSKVIKSEIIKCELTKSVLIKSELNKTTEKEAKKSRESPEISDIISNKAVYDLRKSKFPSRAQSTTEEQKTDTQIEIQGDSEQVENELITSKEQKITEQAEPSPETPPNTEKKTFKMTKMEEEISFQDLNKSIEQLKNEYDLKIENVVLSQEVKSQLGNEVLQMSINALKNVGKELLGGLLQIDSRFPKPGKTPDKMNLQEIRELHYLQQQMLVENSLRVGVKSGITSPSNGKQKGNFKKTQPNNFKVKINRIKQDLSAGKRFKKERMVQSTSFQPSELLNSMMTARQINVNANAGKRRHDRRSKVNKSAQFLNLAHLNRELSDERGSQPKRKKVVKFSVNRQTRPTQWKQERNRRKKQRLGSQQKFFKQMRKSLHKLSARMGAEEQHRSMQNNTIRDLSGERKTTSIRACSEEKPTLTLVRTMPDIESIPEKYTSSRFVSESRTSEFEKTHQDILNYSFGQNDINARTFPVQTRLLESTNKQKRHVRKQPPNPKFDQSDFLKNSMDELRRKINEPLTRLNKKNRKSKKVPQKENTSNKRRKKKKKKMIEWNHENSSSEASEERSSNGDEQEMSLQSGIPLNVSQSNSEPRPWKAEKKRQLIDFEEINDFQIRNLNKNFNSFASWFFVNKSQPKLAPKGKANSGSKQMFSKGLRPVNINSLKEKKREIMRAVCGKVEKAEVKDFMFKVFGKFSRKKFFGDKEIERLAGKHFGESAEVRNKVVPYLYQLIDVEISIQSKHLNRMI